MASAGECHPRESGPSLRADSEEAGGSRTELRCRESISRAEVEAFVPTVARRASSAACLTKPPGRVGQLRHNFNIQGRCLVPHEEEEERCATDQDGGRVVAWKEGIFQDVFKDRTLAGQYCLSRCHGNSHFAEAPSREASCEPPGCTQTTHGSSLPSAAARSRNLAVLLNSRIGHWPTQQQLRPELLQVV